MLPLSLPSPSQGVWYLGPVPLRAYAVCIILGIVAAVWLAEKRWTKRGGEPGVISDIVLWAVPFGVVGGRLYHLLTEPQLYFAAGRDPWAALYVWQGGLGIWGAIALGASGAWIGARRKSVRFGEVAGGSSPGDPPGSSARAVGNWFNQELFGSPTSLRGVWRSRRTTAPPDMRSTRRSTHISL